MHGRHPQKFQGRRVLEPALRVKAQIYSNSRGWKGVICREFYCREEKRKSAYWVMQWDGKTSYSVGWAQECILMVFFALPLGTDAFRMQMGIFQ
jgi:hypothetical protein